MALSAAVRNKIVISVLLAPVTGMISYFARGVLESWGVLDPYAAQFGQLLRSTDQKLLLNVTALSIGVALYISALIFVWWKHRSAKHWRAKGALGDRTARPAGIFRRLTEIGRDLGVVWPSDVTDSHHTVRGRAEQSPALSPKNLEWKNPTDALEAFGDEFLRAARDGAKTTADVAESNGHAIEAEIRELRHSGRIKEGVRGVIPDEYDLARRNLVDCVHQYDRAKEELDRIIGDLHADFMSKLRAAKLIAKGFPMPHKPGNVEVEIPTDEWRILWLDYPNAKAVTTHSPTEVVYTGILIREA